MFKKLILATSIMMAFTACSFDKNDKNDNMPKAREKARLEKEFGPVLGAYQGTLTTPSGTQTVSFNLYTLSANNGAEITLNSNYKRVDPIGKDFNFKVDFIPETGSLTFSNVNLDSNPNSGKIEADDIHTISAKFQGQSIVGEVKSRSGLIGVLNAKLSGKEHGTPGDKQEQEYYDRLAKEYEKVTGVYDGLSVNDENKSIAIVVDVRVRKLQSGNLSVPQIYGLFRWKADTADTSALNLIIEYRNDLNPPRLNMEGTPRDFQTRPYKAFLDAVIEGNTMIGSWSSTRGFEGNFRLTRPTPKPTEPTQPTPVKPGEPEKYAIVCVAGELKVRDASLNKTLFTVKSGEKVIQSAAATDSKTKIVGGTQYTFVKSQFPDRKGAIGWIAREFIRAEGQCPK